MDASYYFQYDLAMDIAVDVPYGPHPLQKIGTVTVPRELTDAIGLQRGEKVHWALNPHMPGTLVLIPSAQVGRVMGEILGAIVAAG